MLERHSKEAPLGTSKWSPFCADVLPAQDHIGGPGIIDIPKLAAYTSRNL